MKYDDSAVIITRAFVSQVKDLLEELMVAVDDYKDDQERLEEVVERLHNIAELVEVLSEKYKAGLPVVDK